MVKINTLLMVFVENAQLMKLGMVNNVFVFLDTSKSMDIVELVTLTHITMVKIAFVIMDSLVMLINVNLAILVAENVQDPMLINVNLALMLVMI